MLRRFLGLTCAPASWRWFRRHQHPASRGTQDHSRQPRLELADARHTANFFMGGGAALPADSMGTPWSGNYVFSTGNLILDFLHNFFLENGARIHKLRVYETVSDPVSREICGYLLVRGGVHAHAYALALKHLTGVDLTKMLPVPNIPTEKFPEARRYLESGSHRRLYKFSPNDYAEIAAIWGGGEQALPGEPAGPLEIVDGHPDGGKIPNLAGISEAFTPDYQPEEIFEIASKLYKAFKG